MRNRTVFVPSSAGLGLTEREGLRRLSPRSLAILVPELSEPGSLPTVRRILRSQDPERALAAQIAEDTLEAVRAARYEVSAGLGDLPDDGLGGLKRYAKKAKKAVKAVAKKVAKPVIKVAKKAIEIKKAVIKKVGKAVMPTLKKYAPVIIGAAGAILAIPTGGASVAFAAALSAGYGIARQKKEAKKIEKIQKRESAAIAAQAAEDEKTLTADLDRLFDENPDVFATVGITKAQWSALTIDQKLAIIEKINKGQMPASVPAADAAAEEQGVPPQSAAPAQDWWSAIGSSPISQAFQDAESVVPDEPSQGAAPPSYELYVEGKKVSESPTLEGLSAAIEEYSQPGDRVLVMRGGQPLGLKIRTEAGLFSVPNDQVQKVLAMTPAEVRTLISKSTSAAAEPVASSGGGWGWLLIPAAAVAAIVVSSK